MREPRTLRRKKHRHALWDAQDGRCARCGEPLEEGWHADHVEPWRARQITNVHEMEALCRRCNLQKGGKQVPDIAGMRAWQTKFRDAIRETKRRGLFRFLIIVTPAGGKASVPYLAKMFADIDAPVCWLTPRESLCDGGAEVPGWITQFCVQHAIKRPVFRVSGNDKNPARGTDGYITTYQGVVADPDLHVKEFERQGRDGEPYILILDEVQFLADEDQKWGAAVHKLIERAGILIIMSGTPYRTDGQRIPVAPYAKNAAGDEELNVEHPDWESIIYTRREALVDRAIIPIELIYRDARGEFFNRWGRHKAFASLDDMKTLADQRDALRVALNPESAREILIRMLDNWMLARRRHLGKQALVIADRQHRAEEYVDWIREHYPSARVGLAITREGPASRQVVRDFRHGKLDILVTVGVAHVGMDAVRVTHIALLTYIRARGWLEQAIARGVRIDPESGPWETQRCTIWTIDDPLLVDVMGRIEEEQIEALEKHGIQFVPRGQAAGALLPGVVDAANGRHGVPHNPDGDGEHVGVDGALGPDGEPQEPGGDQDVPPPPGDNIRALPQLVPLYSALTDVRSHELNKIKLDRPTTTHFATVAADMGLPLTPIEVFQFLNRALSMPPDETVQRVAVSIGIREVEDKIRQAIQKTCNAIDGLRGVPYKTTNDHVMRRFGKSRTEMELAELQQVWAYVNMLWDQAATAQC